MKAIKCPKCGERGVRSVKYDAYACKICDIWLESQCGDANCQYCPNRPTKPSEVS